MDGLVFKYRFMYEKVYPATFLGHLDIVRMFGRAVRRTSLPVCYSSGFTQRPIVSFGPPLPFGYSGLEELVDFRFESRLSPARVVEEMNAVLPDGVRLTCGALLDPHLKSISATVAAADHVVKLPIRPERAERAVAAFEAVPDFWIDIVKGKKKRCANLKEFIAKLGCAESLPELVKVNIRILFSSRGTVPAREAAAAVFGLSDEEKSSVEIARGRFYKSLDPPVALFIP